MRENFFPPARSCPSHTPPHFAEKKNPKKFSRFFCIFFILSPKHPVPLPCTKRIFYVNFFLVFAYKHDEKIKSRKCSRDNDFVSFHWQLTVKIFVDGSWDECRHWKVPEGLKTFFLNIWKILSTSIKMFSRKFFFIWWTQPNLKWWIHDFLHRRRNFHS